jgi:hypothetical protein
MKLTDLHPRWLGAGGDGVYMPGPDACALCAGVGCDTCHSTGKAYVPAPTRTGVGISFDCPCATCVAQRTGNEDDDFYLRVFVGFSNPIDGGPPHDPRPGAQWQRTGERFDALTLTPSILRRKEKGGCGWHGFITNGEIVTV